LKNRLKGKGKGRERDRNVKGSRYGLDKMGKSVDVEEGLKIDILSFIESMEDGVLVTDIEGKILKTNKRFVEMTGYTEEKLIGNNIDRMIENLVKEKDQEHSSEILKEKARSSVDLKIETRRGEERYIDLNSFLIEEEEKVLNLIIARDITEEKKRERALEKSRKKYRTMLELSPDGIAVHRNGKLQYINPSGAEMLGMELNEVIRHTILGMREVAAELELQGHPGS